MKFAILQDSSEWVVHYGYLTWENATHEQVQNKIDSIKNELWQVNPEWTIDDVIEKMPSKWNVNFINDPKKLYI